MARKAFGYIVVIMRDKLPLVVSTDVHSDAVVFGSKKAAVSEAKLLRSLGAKRIGVCEVLEPEED